VTPNLPATIPDAHGTVLADSPHLYTVYSLLCSGWHPVKVAVYIAQTTGVQFPVEAISAYLATIPEEDLLPTTAIARHFRHLDVIADPIGTMHEMLLLRKHSLAQKIEAAGDEAWTATIDGDIKDVFTMAAELKGMLDGNQPAHPVDAASSKTTPTLRDLTRRKIASAERVTTKERVTFEADDDVVDGEATEVEDI
jgi:hypothetical protein